MHCQKRHIPLIEEYEEVGVILGESDRERKKLSERSDGLNKPTMCGGGGD